MAIFRGVGGSGDSSDNSFLDEVTAQAQSAEASATAAANSATSALNTELTSASFNTSNGVLTLTKQDGDTVTTDLDGRFLLTESNDLSSSVTWANVPNANITQSSVTQHQAALSITESQISDLQSYLTSYSETDPVFSAHAASDVTSTKITNWDSAYNDKITAVNYSGSTLTLTQQDGGTLTTTINGALGTSLVYNGTTKAEAVATGINVTGKVTADDELKITASSGYGRIEVGGTSGAFLDLKSPDSDDYDVRLITSGSGGILNVASGEFVIQRGGSQRLATTSTGIDVTGGITASGNVGIGTASPSANLHVSSSGDTIARITSADGNSAFLDLGDASDPDGGRIVYDSGSNLSLYTASTERMRIDSSGNVGIGTSTVYADLQVHETSGAKLWITANGNNPSDAGRLRFAEQKDGFNYFEFKHDGSANKLSLDTTNGTLATFDRINQRVGIGTANPSYRLHVDAGTDTAGGAKISRTKSATDDNGILTLTNNSTTGSNSGYMLMLSQLSSASPNAEILRGGIGLTKNAGGNQFTSPYIFHESTATAGAGVKVTHSSYTPSSGLHPCTTDGSATSGTFNLGATFAKWATVYATTGTINTSDRTEKQDIEALNDAETRVAVAVKGLLRKYRYIDAVAEKGDNARIHFGIIAQDLQAAFVAEGLDAGKYAMFCSDTWYEYEGEAYPTQEEAPEGATEVTKLGVRYSELLAFIISAI